MPKNKFRWSADAKQRLLRKIEIVTESGCWIFMGKLDRNGYGKITDDNQKQRQAHIVSFEIFIGPVPDGLELDHTCRVRCCVNPWHVEPVTHGENLRRGAVAIGGLMACTKIRAIQMKAQTACKYGHEYTADNTRLQKKNGARLCRTCANISKIASYHRNK